MTWLRKLWLRFSALFHKEKLDAQMDDEMRSHIEMQTQENIETGMTPEEARYAALRQFGRVEAIKETCRDQRGLPGLETLWQDIRYGARQLRKNPGFTAVAVLTLALGIGTTTAIFSIVNTVLLQPLPYEEPGQLVNIWAGKERGRNHVAGGMFLEWKQQSTSFENLSVVQYVHLNLIGDGRPERISGTAVSASFLDILRARLVLGRAFLPNEEEPGQDRVVVLSHGFWQRRFGGDTNLVGRTIHLGEHRRTVIGILAPEFLISQETEFLIPFVFGAAPWATSQENAYFEIIARLKRGMARKVAQAEMDAIMERLEPNDLHRRTNWGATLVPMRETITANVRPMLLMLLGAVSFVLLIACANIANLLLARTTVRQNELAIRSALGAGRLRIARQLLTESMLLAVLGGILGVVFAFWSVNALSHLSELSLPRIQNVRPDTRMLGITILVSLAAGLFFGSVPALQVSALAAKRPFESGNAWTTGSRNRLRSALIVSEVALALVLLAGTGLLLRSFLNLQAAPLGFDPRNALTVEISLPEEKYSNAELRTAFLDRVIQRIESLPGVDAVGLAHSVPLVSTLEMGFKIEGSSDRSGQPMYADYDFCSAGYLRALDVPLVKGRFLTPRDDARSARVVLVDETFADRYFPNETPLGRHLEAGGSQWEIVGVVGNVRHRRLAADFRPRVYAPHAFSPFNTVHFVVRTAQASANLAQVFRQEIFAIDPEQPVSRIRTLEQLVSDSVARRRLTLMLLGTFTGGALLLSAIGLYGVMAFLVTQRTREIGLRMALGAETTDVLRLILKHGMAHTLIGVGVGLGGAFALSRVMDSQLYEIGATDPATLAAVSLLLVGVAFVATFLPACRAARVDPMLALRNE